MQKMIIFIFTGLFLSQTSYAQRAEIYAPSGKAINGYDAVSFFKENKAVKGSDDFSYTWKDVQWNFVSQLNLDSFRVDPDKYAPQFGGFCAFGISQGHKAPTQIDTWTIVEGKLYFNYNQKVKQLWQKNQTALIDTATINWPRIKNAQF